MKIKVSYGEIIESGDWQAYCDIAGVNPRAIREGTIDLSDTVEITVEDAKKIRLIPW